VVSVGLVLAVMLAVAAPALASRLSVRGVLGH